MKQNQLKEVCLEITNACPMNCVHCSSGGKSSLEEEMSLDRIKKLVVEIAELGGEVIEISGGEPTVHSGLVEIIRCAKDCGLETRLYTSGFHFSERMINQLISSELDKVIFNLQGADRKTHECITQTNGSFRNVTRSIKMVARDLWVGVHFVPMKPNFRELEKVIQLCSELQVNEIGILRFMPQGRGEANRPWLELSRREFREVTEEAIRQFHYFDNPIIRIGNPFNFCSLMDSSIPVQPCHAGLSSCLIKPDGEVAPCPAFKQNRNYVAGNIRKNTLKDIWRFSPIWNQFRMFDYKRLDGTCKSCEHLPLCRGRCHSQRILAFGDIYKGPDPHCSFYECAQEVPPMKIGV